ncbi:MAG: DUF3108 domain-containing protein [Desulfobaccales bacterium]
MLEDLQYQVNVLSWKDAVRGRLTLKSLGGGLFLAEVSGQAQGFLGDLSGQRRDTYQTEMVWRKGKLLPLVYREEIRKRGKRSFKEYRFNYAQARVEMWQWKENSGKMVRKWQALLKGDMYDPLSAFYNLRLGTLGPLTQGDIVKVTGIPYPRPEDVEVRIGAATRDGREAMVSFSNGSIENRPVMVFVVIDGRRVPVHAWTHISFGKVTGELLPQGKALRGGLPEAAATPGVPRNGEGG